MPPIHPTYYVPFFIREEGWFFLIPAAAMPAELQEHGDNLAGPWPSEPEAACHVRVLTTDFVHHNDNGEAS
jgi:hypothetical protein